MKIRAILALALALVSCLFLVACDSGEEAFTFAAPGGVKVAIGASAEDVIADLGTYLSLNESDSCGGIPGKDRVYTYTGFRVSTTPAEGGDIVCKIELTEDSLKTPEGLYIGMSATDVEAKMTGKGTPERVGDNLVYAARGMKLNVVIRGDSVVAIQYVAV